MQKRSSKTTGKMARSRTKTTEKTVPYFLEDREFTLILYNDNVNTFDQVIDALADFCLHSYEQAAQCAWIAHCTGRCEIMHDKLIHLRPIALMLAHRNLTIDII